MNFDTSTLMMIFFIIFLVISMWKISAFLPNEQLDDDDRTSESKDILISIIEEELDKNGKNLSLSELFEKVKNNDKFDEKHFWRFNQNRLNQLTRTLNIPKN